MSAVVWFFTLVVLNTATGHETRTERQTDGLAECIELKRAYAARAKSNHVVITYGFCGPREIQTSLDRLPTKR